MEEFGDGGHVCLIYDSPEEKWQKVLPYVRVGLETKKRVVYVAEEENNEEVRAALAVPRDLVIMRARDVYYPTGVFDPELMLESIARVEKEALRCGYSGFVGIGEMTWMFEDISGSDKLIEYEQNLTKFLRNRKINVVCMYNKQRFGPEMINLMLRIHTRVVGKGD